MLSPSVRWAGVSDWRTIAVKGSPVARGATSRPQSSVNQIVHASPETLRRLLTKPGMWWFGQGSDEVVADMREAVSSELWPFRRHFRRWAVYHEAENVARK